MSAPSSPAHQTNAASIDHQSRGYIICAMPRSGSYYLCDLLTSTGVLGRPTEYLNPDALRFLRLPMHADDPRERAQQALRLGSTDNGIYGIKVLAHHFDHYTYRGWLDDLPNRTFIYLTRDDLLGQALSLARAQQTQQWTSAMPSSRPDCGLYDLTRIRHCLNELVLDEARWRAFFARNGITPLHASYEELLAQPQCVVARIAEALDITGEPQIDPQKLSLKVQRDGETDAWRDRFLNDSADLGYLDSNRIPLHMTAAPESAASGLDTGTAPRLIVWGAGMAAQTTIGQRFDVSDIAFVIDSDSHKHGQTFLGLPIRPPEALLDEHNCLVLISSATNEPAIRRMIDERFSTHVQRIVTLDDALLDPRARA